MDSSNDTFSKRLDLVEALVREKLLASGLTVRSEGDIEASEIDEKRLIDQHYGAIAAKAVLLKPSELVVQEKAQKEFQELPPGACSCHV